MAKYLANVAGKKKEVQPITTSAGAGDASKIPQTDSAGRLDVSLMPAGISAEVTVVPSFENLTAGDFVNLFNDGGAVKARKADATTNAKPADGFVLSNVTAPANATVYGVSSKNTALTSLTIAVEYWLSTTPGAVTATAPSATGNIVQLLGKAESTTALVFSDRDYYELI